MAQNVLEIVIVCILLIGTVLWGRAFCGKLCPMGFLQDLLHKIPFPPKIKTFHGDKYFRFLKYGVLLFLPISFFIFHDKNSIEVSTVSVSPIVLIGFIVILFSFVVINRWYCKYFCPIGALLSIGNKVSIFKHKINTEKCTQCGVCIKSCKMDIIPYKGLNQLECIRCTHCKKVCPFNAIT